MGVEAVLKGIVILSARTELKPTHSTRFLSCVSSQGSHWPNTTGSQKAESWVVRGGGHDQPEANRK